MMVSEKHHAPVRAHYTDNLASVDFEAKKKKKNTTKKAKKKEDSYIQINGPG